MRAFASISVLFAGLIGLGACGIAPDEGRSLGSSAAALADVDPMSDANTAQRSLVIDVIGTGQGSVALHPRGARCRTAHCSYELDDSEAEVTLTAVPSLCSKFKGWSGGTCSGPQPTCTFDSLGYKQISAMFVQVPCHAP